MLPTKWQDVNNTDSMVLKVINGIRAFCSQTFAEHHKKEGRIWSASRLIIDAPTSAGAINSTGVYYSIIKTGSLPVNLNRREFARTGTAIVEDVFVNPVYTGGTPDALYNVNDITPYTFEMELLTGFTLTSEGTKFAPTVYSIGPASQQNKGSSAAPLGEDYIFAPNTSYLLKFYSTDGQLQDITARISGYEGLLDVPSGDAL
jgi:hypothetical protein